MTSKAMTPNINTSGGLHAHWRRALVLCLSLGLGMAATSSLGQDAERFAAPERLSDDGFRELLIRVAPRVLMAGQPTPAGLARAQGMGVTHVVNLRTHREMDDRSIVDFDEAAELKALGLTYTHLPLGGPDTPYTPAAVDALAAALQQNDGQVLLHCTVAWRATHLWMAYLVRHHNYTVAEAVAVGRDLNFGPLPLEEFLGQPIPIGGQP